METQMKNVLAVTACLKRCSVAVSYENSVYEINENVDSAGNLVHLARRLIEENRIDLKNIHGVITCSGPGSFTGIRCAQSFAKGFSLALKVPAAGIDYFDVIDSMRLMSVSSEDPLAKKNHNNNENRFIAIGDERDQIFFKNISGDGSYQNTGIVSYENIEKTIAFDEFTLLGNVNRKIMDHIEGSKNIFQVDVTNFREARHFLNLSDRITDNSEIKPFYMEKPLVS
jgi:tRNA threonylcarbamoyl adenosine modification protein YeaZ